MIAIENWSPGTPSRRIAAFLRREAFPEAAEKAASETLADIRARGDAAVADAVARFEGNPNLRPRDFRIPESELASAASATPPAIRRAVRDAWRRVLRFAKAGLRKDWKIRTPHGGFEGEFFTPMERVGVYVPGGTAPLASTAVMTATLARAAGVKDIVVCTPGGRTGAVNPVLLYALKLAGATSVYRVGGIQAIGMMAFGTKSCPKVLKIAGPGNAFVTAAKRQVYGHVAIDQVAGPSEIAVLADGSVDPAWVAADLLSQAEHGSGYEKSLLVTDSRRYAEAVRKELLRLKSEMAREIMVDRVISSGGILFAVAGSLEDGLELVNRFAPEHLELMCRGAGALLKKVRNAGAVFAGPWTPESAGDFVAGPSHVLPTGGAARMFGGLTADDFRCRHSFVSFARGDLEETAPTIAAFAETEGLDGHGRAASIRLPRGAAGAKGTTPRG